MSPESARKCLLHYYTPSEGVCLWAGGREVVLGSLLMASYHFQHSILTPFLISESGSSLTLWHSSLTLVMEGDLYTRLLQIHRARNTRGLHRNPLLAQKMSGVTP